MPATGRITQHRGRVAASPGDARVTATGPARTALAGAVVLAFALASAALAPIAGAAAGFGEIKGPGACLRQSGTPGDSECAPGNGVLHPQAIAVSPDGTSVYVVGGTTANNIAESFGSVAILKRNPATGEVSDAGCMSSDGTDGRDGASGICTPSASLLGADGVSVSADGRTVFIASQKSASVIAFARDPASGSLTRLGCLAAPRAGSPCAAANVFRGSSDIVTSPDDSSLFLASPDEGTLSALIAPPPPAPAGEASAPPAGTPAPSSALASLFAPAPSPSPAPASSPAPAAAAGPPRPNPCVAVNGYDGACALGVAMKGVGSLTVSPDGQQVYAVAPQSQAVDVFAAAGAEPLAQIGCLKAAAPPGLCSSSALLSAPKRLAISPDGRNLYVADSGDHGGRIDVLSRNAATGKLADAGCVDFLPQPVKPEAGNGEEPENEKEQEQEREQEEARERERLASDPCQSVPGLESVEMVAVSGDGSAVWAFGAGSAVSFSRDPSTGKLTETGCASSSDARCASLPDLTGFETAAVSPDGRNVYIATGGERALLAFGIGAAVTAARVSASQAGIARVPVACPAQLRRPCRARLVLTRRAGARSQRAGAGHAWRVAAGASGVFTLGPGHHAQIAVRLYGATRGLVLHGRRLRITATVRAAARAGGSGLGRRVVLALARR